jgi:type I restriction enzyme R subunit
LELRRSDTRASRRKTCRKSRKLAHPTLESETLQQQAQNNSLAQFSASPDLHNEFLSAVIGAMDSSADLSAQILNNPELSQKLLGELVPIIYKELKSTA